MSEYFVLVNTDQNNRIDNIDTMNNARGTLPDGYIRIPDDKWAEGEAPTMGMRWTGGMPAAFEPIPDPVASDGDDLTTKTPAELLGELDQLSARQDEIRAEIARQLGGS